MGAEWLGRGVGEAEADTEISMDWRVGGRRGDSRAAAGRGKSGAGGPRLAGRSAGGEAGGARGLGAAPPSPSGLRVRGLGPRRPASPGPRGGAAPGLAADPREARPLTS